MCVDFDAGEEMSPATAKQAVPQLASRAWIEYVAHTSLMEHRSKQATDLYLLSSKSPDRRSRRCIPPVTTLADPLIASPCHLGMGDLPLPFIAPCSIAQPIQAA